MNARVCNQMGWDKTVEMDLLRSIQPVSMGPRHNPVNHGEVLQRFLSRANNAGVKIESSTGLLSQDRNRYMYVADIRYDSIATDFAFTIGFVNFNDRSKAFTMLAGQRVFVCSNLCVTGVIDEGRTRHSTNVDNRLDARIDTAFDTYNNMFRIQLNNVDAMKATKLTDELLGKFVLSATRMDFMGATNIRRIIEEVDTPTLNNKDDNSLWRLHNAATWVIKENIKNPLFVAESTNKINSIISGITVA